MPPGEDEPRAKTRDLKTASAGSPSFLIRLTPIEGVLEQRCDRGVVFRTGDEDAGVDLH